VGAVRPRAPRTAAFTTLERDPADALLVSSDGFFVSRRVQLALLAAFHRVPATFASREYAEAGGLMSYGTDTLD
jgi:putative tryptophan/tyrosine transport system substrate-binding protein